MTSKLIVLIISTSLSTGLRIKLAAEEGKPEHKFEFNLDGEARGYIGLDQARIQAIEHARDHTEFYGPAYQGASLVWEVRSAEESDDYYDIRLSFRPSGRFQGRPGVEQFIFDKTGELRIRQMLDEPTGISRRKKTCFSSELMSSGAKNRVDVRIVVSDPPVVESFQNSR